MKKLSMILGTALLLAAAALLGTTVLRGKTGVTLDEVLAQVEQAQAYSYQLNLASDVPGKDSGRVGQHVEFQTLIAPSQGMKITSRIEDPNAGIAVVNEKYILAGGKRMTTVLPAQKQYIELICDADYWDRVRIEHDDPAYVVRRLRDCDHRKLGPSSIDGISVEGFQSSDPAFLLGTRGETVDVRLWVDRKSRLPVCLEKTVGLTNGRQLYSRVANADWAADVQTGAFEPVIPTDYKAVSDGPLAMPKIDERTALQGLQFLANLGGAFPKHLDLKSLVQDVRRFEKSDTPAAKALREQKWSMSKEDSMKRMVEIMMPIRGLSEFYHSLQAEGKAPAYFGATVTPGDKAQVLMRWRVSEGLDRVVYGNLQVESLPSAGGAKVAQE